ncbi:MAG: orotidine-5'-phosphate decarboxylase [Candidatus Aenigmatarchaeota archaeon]|nr:MAG: orotidine-5'-phosphate decarboxylase [Candidatus Aenigmarchaeota archaeon]
MNFIEKYEKARDEKNSIISVGLDPLLDNMKLKEKPTDIEKISELFFNFCMELIDNTGDYACAIKPNTQFILFPLTLNQIKKINKRAHDYGLVSVLDHKLGDIGSTNASALYWIKQAGFDALTFSPFAGNIKEATKQAHAQGLGLICLTLMSNPDSVWVQKEAMSNGMPLYEKIAHEIKNSDADGCVVGATGHVTDENIKKIRTIVGNDRVFLCPGIGAQGGDIKKILRNAGKNILIHIGRSIMYADDQKKAAEEFCNLINNYR